MQGLRIKPPTDIDRLHAVLTGRLIGRRCGKTTATCHLIAGLLEMEVPPYIHCLVSHQNDMQYARNTLQEVLEEHDIASMYSDYFMLWTWTPVRCTIVFHVAGFLEPGELARYEYVFDLRRHAHPAFPRKDFVDGNIA